MAKRTTTGKTPGGRTRKPKTTPTKAAEAENASADQTAKPEEQTTPEAVDAGQTDSSEGTPETAADQTEPAEADQADDAPTMDAQRDPGDETGSADGDDTADKTPDLPIVTEVMGEESASQSTRTEKDEADRTTPPDPANDAAIAPPSAPPERPSSMPTFFGGLVAGLLGAALLYAAAITGLVNLGSRDVADSVVRQDGRIADLSDRITSVENGLSIASDDARTARDEIAGAVDGLRAEIAVARDEIAALDERVSDIEVQPIPEAELPQEIVEAYETRLAEMQASLDARLAEIEAAADQASAVEAQAEARANVAAARASMAELTAALENGQPFAAPLDDIASRTDANIADVLRANAQDGIPSAAALQAAYPEAARAALDASLGALADEGEIGGFSAFMRSQLGARSLEPREGDDPDAVLSRAEAAMRSGDITAALSEIEALPEPGRAALAEWAAMAELRRTALSAAEDLARTLNES